MSLEAKDAEIARLQEQLSQAQQEVDEVLDSTKEIEAQLESDILRAEAQIDSLQVKNKKLQDEVHQWKDRCRAQQAEYDKEMESFRKEHVSMSETLESVRQQLRDEELRRDELERHERILTTSYQDLEIKFHDSLERNAVLEGDLVEKSSMTAECQRLRDQVGDLTEELAILANGKWQIKLEDGQPKILETSDKSPSESDNSNEKQSYFVNMISSNLENKTATPKQYDGASPDLGQTASMSRIQGLTATVQGMREKTRAANRLADVPSKNLAMNRCLQHKSLQNLSSLERKKFITEHNQLAALGRAVGASQHAYYMESSSDARPRQTYRPASSGDIGSGRISRIASKNHTQ